jgi:hypothetical protein
MNFPFDIAALTSHEDSMPAGALDVCRPDDARGRGPKLPPVAYDGVRVAVDEFLMSAIGKAMPKIRSARIAQPGADQPTLMDEGFERAQRVASGRADTADIAWLSKGFSAFLAGGGALPLERCLGLPRNDCALRRACRDYWLRRAWQALDDDLSPWQRSEKLAAAVRKFRMGSWLRWRTLENAPTLASEMELALFDAFRSWERVPQTAMQLHNIAHHRRHS